MTELRPFDERASTIFTFPKQFSVIAIVARLHRRCLPRFENDLGLAPVATDLPGSISFDAAAPLVEAAFGAAPDMRYLPMAESGSEAWLRAVALGGQGHYSRARAELARARMAGRDVPELLSYVASTEASFRRQLGGHALAAFRDGAALAHAGPSVGARCDALTGLAADALGTDRLDLSRRLLDRCAEALQGRTTPDLWRQRLRLSWVRAELAMASGAGADAVRFAQDARRQADDCPSVRHRVKTELLLAAASCVAGAIDDARLHARDVARQCDDLGLLPLRWACAMLLAGIDPGGEDADVAVKAATEIARRGGQFATV